MSVYGQGSAYSFKTGDFNPGFTNGMGQDPRQIVAKSGIDSMKGAEYAGGAPRFPVPGMAQPGQRPAVAANPFGTMFNKDAKPGSTDLSPLFGGQNVDYESLRNNLANIQNPVAQLAANAIGTANPYAFSPGQKIPSFDMSQYTNSNLSEMYRQAYEMLNLSRQNITRDTGDNRLGPGSWNPMGGDNRGTYRTWDDTRMGREPGPADGGYQQWLDYRNRGQGTMMSTALDQAMDQLQTSYQSWLNKQMASGAFGLTGSTVSY